MGCDIHIAVQVKRDFKNEWDTIIHPMGAYCSRNYVLFSILADVRNEWEVVPICGPKGLPEGFIENDEYPYWLGEHSFSFLTIEEIRNYDWNKNIKKSAVEGTCGLWCSEFLDWLNLLENFTKLKYTSDKNIRLVFGFDS